MNRIWLPMCQHRLLGHKALSLLISACVGVSICAVGGSALYAQEITPQTGSEVQVSPYLAAEVAAGAEDVSILVLLKDQPDLAALQSAAISAGSSASLSAEERRTARINHVYQTLTAHALQSQQDLRTWLEAQQIPYRGHYIINMVSVTGGAALVEALRQRPDVARLDANPQVNTMHLATAGGAAASAGSWARWVQMPEVAASPNTPYGLEATRAPEVWAQGYTGQGIVIASQDTGVEWDHAALLSHYRGASGETVDHTYNWLNAIPESIGFDACAGENAPCDDNGHGTHTVGTMVGSTNIITYGVAPGALWMGCRNMRSGVGTPETYTTCFEFFLAPYPPDGDPFVDGRPELAPHIINNSWGCPPSEGCNKDSLRQVVEMVRAAGLMVVASAGNNGSAGCSSMVDPIAIYDATFTVGAHDAGGNLAPFSSRGPVAVDSSGRLKPDIAAPGVSILSAHRFGGATVLSGTSMASPHVAGAVALLWSAAPWLVGEIDLTEQVLLKSATPVYSNLCDDATEGISPNPTFGYGRLDVAAAVEMALQPWEVTVVVSDSTGTPLAGAEISLIDARTGYTYTETTDVGGSVTISPTLAGHYTLQVQEVAAATELQLANDGRDTVQGSGVAATFSFVYTAEMATADVPELRYFIPSIIAPSIITTNEQ